MDFHPPVEGVEDPQDIYPIGKTNHMLNVCPLTTSVDITPLVMTENSSTTSGHFYLNHHLRVMARTSFSQKPPVANLQLLQNICSKTPYWSVPLIYLEGMLFHRIFWATESNSVIGAIPSVFYTNAIQRCHQKTLAPLKDHLMTRILNNSLLTSHDMSYLQFEFDIILNSDLNKHSAKIACHRGLEAAVREWERIHADTQDGLLQVDDIDSRRQVNQLVATLLTEGAWTYFITLTCNDSATPGVAPLRVAIQQYADKHCTDRLHDLVQNYSVLLAWERTVHYTWQYITTSHEQILGPVKSSWMRFEFQRAGALGNRPHVHAGITLQDEPLNTTLARIRCSNMSMWAPDTATDFDSLKAEGFIDTANTLQQQSCTKAGGRCMKRRSKDDTFICRVPKHPASFSYEFQDHGILYPEDTYTKLAYLDLVTLCACGHHWETGQQFKAGIWHYPAQKDEHFVPTIP